MEIEVKNIYPNPFRNMERYPIIKEKVDSLVSSIKKTGLWRNMECREVDGRYEIPYGHNRLEAIKKAGIKTIEINVVELSDQAMIQKMADENLTVWRNDPNVTRETVRAVIEKLEKDEDDKNSAFYKYKAQKLADPKARDQGISAKDVAWYLGPPWDKSYQMVLINQAMNEIESIKQGVVEEEDLQTLNKPAQTKALISAVKKEFPDKPKTEKEKKKKKKIIKKIVAGLEAGTIKTKDVEQEVRAEKTGERRKERKKRKAHQTFQELQIEFDKIMGEASTLEKHIVRFLASMDISYRYNPKGWKNFTHSYDVLNLAIGLRKLWEIMHPKKDIEKEWKLIEHKEVERK